MVALEVNNVHVNHKESGKEIVKGVSLIVGKGEIVALMGPNGSGKSTLSYGLMGHPNYEITGGSAKLEGKELKELSPDERAKTGLFLSFQHPATVAGVTVQSFLRAAYNAMKETPLSVPKFRKLLKEKMEILKMDTSFADRYVNEGFSGGEKKRNEILQLSILQPKVAILDETDSGLDIDAIKIVASGVAAARKENPDMGILIITHYKRILEHIKPDRVLVMMSGRIVERGGPELADHLEEHGYEWAGGKVNGVK